MRKRAFGALFAALLLLFGALLRVRAGAGLRRRRHELAVVSRALVRARRRRRAEPPSPGRDALEALRALLPPVVAAEARVIDVPGDRPPWVATGFELRAGETISTFAVGRVHLSRALDLWAGPHHQLWFRVAERGPVFRGTRATNTFTADAAGALELASACPPGVWADPSGELRATPGEYRAISGGMSVLVVRWSPEADSDAVLREVAPADASGLAAAELDRRATEPPEPEGWHHLWQVGRSDIYRGAGPLIECATHANLGILRRDVDFPLSAATRLRWSWRVDELPSELAEDTLPTHDYLSIALEFDNGQDLTWHWSAELPPGHSYRCPIPPWRDRETHMVVRSGHAELGRWMNEERPVRADYIAAVGPPPERIVGVWLIALSLFQRGQGRCAYADIELRDGERVERVLQGAAGPSD